MKKVYLLLIATLVFAGLLHSETDVPNVRVVTHEIRSKGTLMGSIVDKVRKGENETNIETLGELDLDGQGDSPSLVFRGDALWSGNTLMKFDYWVVDQKDSWHLKGVFQKGKGYWMSALRVETRDDWNMDDLKGIGSTILSSSVPSVGMVLDLFSDKMSEEEEMVPFKYYDVMDLDLPNYLWREDSWTGVRKLKVFVTGEMARKKMKVSFLRNETIVTEAGDFSCKVFDIKAKRFKQRCWIAYDELWGAWIVKETRNDDGFLYESDIQSICFE